MLGAVWLSPRSHRRSDRRVRIRGGGIELRRYCGEEGRTSFLVSQLPAIRPRGRLKDARGNIER